MNTAELLIEIYSRVPDGVGRLLDGLDEAGLTARPDPEANTIAWLVWHIARGQDAQVAQVAGTDQAWTADGWAGRFELPFDDRATGYGQHPDEVAQVRASVADLRGYLDDVQRRTLEFLSTLDDAELEQVVDEAWDPPVTLGVRLVSIVGDGLQHLGQAEYVRGLYERSGRGQ
ncbi:DinB family protein [Georgenia sp. SYP-B2076]|uniref:mycothiol transferase n=1 Tax=Georgenia sp. SYP-B2076 TaxID=2495881 RepID=UPI000F8CF7F4|nr:DinB family protein [Georgenia sp. SYP-B2076]